MNIKKAIEKYVLREINEIYILVGIYDNSLIEIDYEGYIVYRSLRDNSLERAIEIIGEQLNRNEQEAYALIEELIAAID